MNLKELIKEVELINSINKTEYSIGKLKGIKKTVEAVEGEFAFGLINRIKGWQELKKLLGLK